MADGAHEITRSLREVFGLDEEQTRRLMCWSHKYRAYSKKLIPVKKLDSKVAGEINNDILKIQWMVQSDEEFKVVFKLLEQKYMEKGEYTEETMALTYPRCTDFHVHKNIDTVQFKRAKRPVGRPRNVEGALRKTPPQALPEPV